MLRSGPARPPWEERGEKLHFRPQNSLPRSGRGSFVLLFVPPSHSSAHRGAERQVSSHEAPRSDAEEPEPGALRSHLTGSTRALLSPPIPPDPAAEPFVTRSVTVMESFGTTAPTLVARSQRQTEPWGPGARPPRAVAAPALLLWGEKHSPTGERPGSKRRSDSQSKRGSGAGVEQRFRIFSLHQLRAPPPRCLLLKRKDPRVQRNGSNVAFGCCHQPAVRCYAEKTTRSRFVFCSPSPPFPGVGSRDSAAPALPVSVTSNPSSLPATPAQFRSNSG